MKSFELWKINHWAIQFSWLQKHLYVNQSNNQIDYTQHSVYDSTITQKAMEAQEFLQNKPECH